MPTARASGPSPFSREAQEWLANYLLLVTSVLYPIIGTFLIYRWYVGILAPNHAVLSVLLLPFAVLPWISKRLSLRTKAVFLLAVYTISAATTFQASGLIGTGPLLSILAAFTALVFYGNRIFLALLASLILAVGMSGFAHLDSSYGLAVDLNEPLNVLGKTLTIAIILSVFLFGLRGVTSLVSEQRDFSRHNSQQLQRALEELNLFIDSANAPIFGVDRHGRVNEWNAKTAAITGYSKQQALGNNLVDTYITEEHKAPVAKVLEAALAGNGTENYELPLYSQAGERIEILLDATTRRDSEGSIIGVIGVGQDITGLREQGERLRQAQKMESVGLLTGGIAHEFNNLLAVIKGNLDLSLDSLGDQDEANLLRDILSDAATASADAAKLTNRLQSFASQQSFRHESVNLRSLVSSALRKALPPASSDIDFSINIDQVDVMVMVDNMQLENAIVSVIDNAKDSIEAAGKISVEAQIERFTGEAAAEYSLQAGEYIVITVGDDGCGIPESSLQRVIEPFFSTKTIGQRAGFGLSVVHGFVNKSGGRLDLKSTVDVGTTVVIVLPFIPATVDRPVSQIQTEEDKFPRRTGTVLVVEDEERLRKLAARHLGSTGFQVIEAGNAEEALKVLATNGDEIDILVSDIRMPGEMSGRELAGQVSKLYPTVRLLLTTGYEEEAPDPSDKARLPEWQIPVLRKPYSRAELIAAVTDLV